MKIVLASGSKRRQELLEQAGYSFEVVIKNVDESNHEKLSPQKYVQDVARRKLFAALPREQNDLVICADTAVVLRNEILGKPQTAEEAFLMISKISGQTHEVITAVEMAYQGQFYSIVSKARVKVRKMTDQQIQEYVLTDEPYDKAGGYAIQGLFAKYIDALKGDFYTVVGLPLFQVCGFIEKLKEKTVE